MRCVVEGGGGGETLRPKTNTVKKRIPADPRLPDVAGLIVL